MLRIPSAGVPVPLSGLAQGLFATDTAPFRDELARLFDVRRAGLVSSGSAAFYLILKALSTRSGRKEVVLPAYTAPVVVLPVLKAGLRPVVADVSLETFNIDAEDVGRVIGPDTLAVMPAHMFGIPCDVEGLREIAGEFDSALVEDAASAFGAKSGGRFAGTLGDAGYYSFHRGKQVSTVTGGAWVTGDDELAAAITREAEQLRYPSPMERAVMFAKLVGFSLAVRPWFYSAFHPLLARFKDTAPHQDFPLHAYTSTQAGVGISLLRDLERIVAVRNQRSDLARQILGSTDAITLPSVLAGTRPAYNHCPLLMPDPETRAKALAGALDAGVECTVLYDRTIYQAYNLKPDEYGGGRCAKAEDLASRLLLIPCHPLIPMARVEQVAEIVKKTATGGT